MLKTLVTLFAGAAVIVASVSRDPAVHDSPAVLNPAPSASLANTPDPPKQVLVEHPDAGVEHVAQKYAFLLDTLAPHARRHALAALARREALDPLDVIAMSDSERELSLVLRSDEYAIYEQLRESEADQAAVRSLAKALEHTAALTAPQQRSLLFARLRHSNAIAALELAVAANAVVDADMEQIYATDVANAGLAHHRERFLEEVRAFLGEEQWTALAERERQ